ncbi:MAG: hypothetical protein B6244_02435 [Candidatus Cloacimonetes bacterium 4572_55]|nr:MAG: hypothetical protein B6244_02435 [Candidatus Cloacimonetes bacterium 4572_55]
MQKKEFKYKWNLVDKIYLPAVLKGLLNTFKHLFMPSFTYEYPDEPFNPAPRFRGEHRLKKDEKGRIKCTACFMCATICPAKCITIVAAPSPEEYGSDRNKYPAIFDVNELRCISCGYCEEVCPKDAIELSVKMPRVYTSREEFIYNRDKLASN